MGSVFCFVLFSSLVPSTRHTSGSWGAREAELWGQLGETGDRSPAGPGRSPREAAKISDSASPLYCLLLQQHRGNRVNSAHAQVSRAKDWRPEFLSPSP
ncbi:uncharacterized protein [Equus asinus]|uniref:uncharacterized protein isoform X7 n=1 Tax=Equus asinus TaxID=9793 RepID=UPI0038F7C232